MNVSLFAFGLGWPEIMMILVLSLIFFGAKKIPELAKGLGQGMKEFKRATNEIQENLTRAIEDEPTPTPLKPRALSKGSDDSQTNA